MKPKRTKTETSAPVSSTPLLGHGHTFELVGAILSVNQACKFGEGQQWISFRAITSADNWRDVEGLPVPPTTLPFIKPGARLKLVITVVP